MVTIFFILMEIVGWHINANAASATVLTTAVPTELSSYFKKSFSSISQALPIQVPDPITEHSPNNIVWEIIDSKKKVLGYAREIQTTTGCNLYCLPLHFIMMLDANLNYKALVEVDPLTKKNHALFTEADRLKLNLLLNSPPASFSKVQAPLDLVDAITRETKLEHQEDVVKEAALTSFRTYQYLKQTQAALKAAKISRP